jgi:hypothetical protein
LLGKRRIEARLRKIKFEHLSNQKRVSVASGASLQIFLELHQICQSWNSWEDIFIYDKNLENLHLRSSEEGAARIPFRRICENFIFFFFFYSIFGV